jgi:hypothetical protein
MRKEDVYSLLVYAVMIVIALFVGLEVIAPSFDATVSAAAANTPLPSVRSWPAFD